MPAAFPIRVLDSIIRIEIAGSLRTAAAEELPPHSTTAG
jgi:hypothetical protein